MQYNVDNVIFPQDFEYIEVVKAGRPTHEKYDSFYLKHPPMELTKRAKIFSPFDALKGFDEEVASKDVIYVDKKELNEDETRKLNITLNSLHKFTANSRLAGENNITADVTYFVPCDDIDNDAYMIKGSYETVTGIVRNIDPVINKSIAIDDMRIPLSDVVRIECSAIPDYAMD